MSAQLVHSLLFAVVVVIALVSIWLQRRALHSIAFGRSMFISATAVLMGLMVGMSPGLAATIVSVVLLVIGIGFMVFMGWVSYRHLRQVKRRSAERRPDAAANEPSR